tara:strand:- start:76 stop:765 length:690 start_codon:yes stop_codon:yes gene_type:complete
MNQFTIEELMAMDEPTRQWALENGLVEGGTPRVGFGPMVDQSQLGLGTQPYQSTAPTPYVSQAPYASPAPTAVMSQPTSSMTYGGSGADPALVSDYDVTGQEGLLDSGAGAGEGMTAGQGYGWGMAGNMAGNMVDAHDKELVDTPLGNQGSKSGMMKGALKGAGTGATIGTMIAPGYGTAVGGAIGGAVGLLGGAQGYFDSRTPPQTRTQTVTPMRGAGFGGQATSLFG